MKEYNVSIIWDKEAYVWFATSTDVPGFALESGSLDALIERVKIALPDLLEMHNTGIKINFNASRFDEVQV